MKHGTRVCCMALLCLASGCATYEFDILQPNDRRAHIGRKTDTVVPTEPLQYRFRAVDGRLVMRIYNSTPDAIQLLGERSYVVAPDGQSRPMRSMTIAPGSFIKVILPPVRPVSYRSGPRFGIGVGGGIGRRHGDGFGGVGVGYDSDPVYAYTEDDGGVTYWDWDGQSEARVKLVYQRAGGNGFEEEWVFARKKM